MSFTAQLFFEAVLINKLLTMTEHGGPIVMQIDLLADEFVFRLDTFSKNK